MEAAEVEHEVERAVHADFGEPGHVAQHQLRAWRLSLCHSNRPRHVLDSGHIPAVVEQVLAVCSCSAAEIESPARRERFGPLDQLD
jgi:hypothetical protein